MQQTQSGNAFIYVLIAIALFAALAYTFTRSGQQGSSDISNQEASLTASEILSYAQRVEDAVNRVRTKNRCSENEISFENATVSGYTNASAPVSQKCHIFETAGGNISWMSFFTSQSNYQGLLGFTGRQNVPDIGSTSNSELILKVRDIPLETCIQINKLLQHDTFTTAAMLDGDAAVRVNQQCPTSLAPCKFAGNFFNTYALEGEIEDTSGINSMCIREGVYTYYHVLLAR